jgi:hypothetical protein
MKSLIPCTAVASKGYDNERGIVRGIVIVREAGGVIGIVRDCMKCRR